MTVQIISNAWNYFHRIPKQDFTGIVVQAIAMCNLIKDFDKSDKNRLQWLRNNTHKDIKRSMYELDRYVDETKGVISNKIISFNGKQFNQDKIQNYLCLAVEEIYEIIYKNFKDFKVEEKMYVDGDETQLNDGGWKF